MGVRRRRHRLRVIAGALVAAALVVLRLSRLEVVGESMAPTLSPGDRVVALRGLPIRAGALVAVPDPRAPARLLVKRVARLADGDVVLVGDNPAASSDSRTFGAVALAAVEGRVVYRYWPRERAGALR